MMNFTVDEEKCTACGSCAADCPSMIIRLHRDRPVIVSGGEAACIRCQHCFAVCPSGAISIFGLKSENSEHPGILPDPDRLAGLLRFRRSVRKFRNEDMSRDEIRKLLEVLKFSPTGCNDHRQVFSVVSGRVKMDELRQRLTERILAAIKAESLPPALGRLRNLELPLSRGIDVLLRGAPHLIIVSAPADAPCPAQDAAIALSQFELLAQSQKIGTTWCGLAMMALALAPDLLPDFGVPEGYRPAYAMLFGKSAVSYARCTQPVPVEVRFA